MLAFLPKVCMQTEKEKKSVLDGMHFCGAVTLREFPRSVWSKNAD